MDKALLEATAAALVAPGKGILAADESNGTMTKRLEGVGLESSAESRRDYRANLFATMGCNAYISGVILYDETIRQSMEEGLTIPDYLTAKGIIPGIKVDTGAKELAGHHGEKVTEGLDDLRERCKEYFLMGARFAKWRAVIKIGENGRMPSLGCIAANAHALARYATICQEQGLVPIIEPEVLMDGQHLALDCMNATSSVLQATFAECEKLGLYLPGALLKPNMILNGKESKNQNYPGFDNPRQGVAEETIRILNQSVPDELGGVVFLSGGQSDEEATDHLNRMNAMDFEHPWQLSYSYGRALQAAALKAWAEEGAEASQAAFAHRAKMNSLARSGDWDISLE